VRFTQFYNTARCCPTRAALLTGLYAHQAGIGHMMDDRAKAGEALFGRLEQKSRHDRRGARKAGYSTYMTGKWHVTKKSPSRKVKPTSTTGRSSAASTAFTARSTARAAFSTPTRSLRDNTYISPYADPEYQPEEYYYTDAINDHAARFVTEHRRAPHRRSRSFLYVAYTAAHWPMHAKEADIAKYAAATTRL
jgi:arylsulfatase A-like enzyme